MNDQVTDLDQPDEEILTYAVSDEVMEVAATAGRAWTVVGGAASSTAGCC
jgi:hypothetical protein